MPLIIIKYVKLLLYVKGGNICFKKNFIEKISFPKPSCQDHNSQSAKGISIKCEKKIDTNKVGTSNKNYNFLINILNYLPF